MILVLGAVVRILKTFTAALCLTAAFPAAATVIHVGGPGTGIGYDPFGSYGGIRYVRPDSSVFDIIGPAGQFQFRGINTSTNAAYLAYTFCVDLFKDAGDGDYLISSLSSITANVTKQQQLAALVTHADAIINAAGISGRGDATASFQLAIWEVLYETGISGYDVSVGNFSTYGDSSTNNYFVPLWGQANGYLANVTNGTWTASANRASILFSETAQSQIVPNAIPEPSSWLMMILGFAGIGAASRRKAKAIATALSSNG